MIDGIAIARAIRQEIAQDVIALRERGVVPGLAVVLVGDDPASTVYVRAKGRACDDAGMTSTTLRLPSQTTEAELLSHVERLNHDPAVHGILVQMPVPKHIDPTRVIRRISPLKDVDRVTQWSYCSGGGGGLPVEKPEITAEISRRRVAGAQRLEVDTLISACPWSERPLSEAGDAAQLEVMDLFELVAQSAGIEVGGHTHAAREARS